LFARSIGDWAWAAQESAVSRWRVPFGYLAGLAVLVLASPTFLSIALGLPLALAGEGVRLWAAGHIEKTSRLATGGPYAHTRNPLYFGSFLIALGCVVAAASPWVAVAAAAYFLIFYPSVIREEAVFLAARFPEEYAPWAGSVPRFLPRLRPAGPATSRFAWARVRANREWRAGLAVPLAFVLLALRGLIPWGA
jgi:protein-S-isoprenylcysteine O-methyltransferase Ste14